MAFFMFVCIKASTHCVQNRIRPTVYTVFQRVIRQKAVNYWRIMSSWILLFVISISVKWLYWWSSCAMLSAWVRNYLLLHALNVLFYCKIACESICLALDGQTQLKWYKKWLIFLQSRPIRSLQMPLTLELWHFFVVENYQKILHSEPRHYFFYNRRE